MKLSSLNWSDRAYLTSLRNYADVPVEGDLWAVLNWPTYHVHGLLEELHPPGGKLTEDDLKDPWNWRSLAYGVLALCADGAAEATEMVTHPDRRRRGFASWLRLIQCRDLDLLGYPVLYQAAKDDAGRVWCATHMDKVGDLPDGSTYYRGQAAEMRERLILRGVRSVSTPHYNQMMQLKRKAQQIPVHLEMLSRMADTQRAKFALRGA